MSQAAGKQQKVKRGEFVMAGRISFNFAGSVDSDSEILPHELLTAIPLNIPGAAVAVPTPQTPTMLVFRRCGCGCYPTSGHSTAVGMLPNAPFDDKRQWNQDRLRREVEAAGFYELAG